MRRDVLATPVVFNNAKRKKKLRSKKRPLERKSLKRLNNGELNKKK
jgi:hypothetical protein